MKTISYTYMREHLTEVLDELRNGELITVTQRGKADIVLNSVCKTVLKPLPKADGWIAVSGSSIKPAIKEGMKAGATHQKSNDGRFMDASKELNSSGSNIVTKKGLSFKDAKERTKVRHAGVIKMLGDK